MRRTSFTTAKLYIRHCSFLKDHPSHSVLTGLPEFATAIEDIANARFQAAIPKLQRTCDIMKIAYPPTAPEVRLATLRLAQSYLSSGDFAHAQPLYIEAAKDPMVASHALPRAVYCALAVKSFDSAHGMLADAPSDTLIDQFRIAALLFTGKTDAALNAAKESHAKSTHELVSTNNLAAMMCYHSKYTQSTLPYFLSPSDAAPSRNQLSSALDMFATAEEASSKHKSAEDVALRASVLCNHGEVLQSLGDAKNASEMFGKAVKLLENQTSLEGHLGRVLYHIGCRYMETGEAITAEGLLKSSFEKFNSPHAKYDVRHQYHHARALVTYGTLLSRWEKRENDGATYMAKGMEKLKTLPNSGDIYLNHFLYLPM